MEPSSRPFAPTHPVLASEPIPGTKGSRAHSSPGATGDKNRPTAGNRPRYASRIYRKIQQCLIRINRPQAAKGCGRYRAEPVLALANSRPATSHSSMKNIPVVASMTSPRLNRCGRQYMGISAHSPHLATRRFRSACNAGRTTHPTSVRRNIRVEMRDLTRQERCSGGPHAGNKGSLLSLLGPLFFLFPAKPSAQLANQSSAPLISRISCQRAHSQRRCALRASLRRKAPGQKQKWRTIGSLQDHSSKSGRGRRVFNWSLSGLRASPMMGFSPSGSTAIDNNWPKKKGEITRKNHLGP